MKISEIKDDINEIKKKYDDDPEAGHSMEDGLMADFIRYIAKTQSKSALGAKAKLILSCIDTDFDRWYA